MLIIDKPKRYKLPNEQRQSTSTPYGTLVYNENGHCGFNIQYDANADIMYLNNREQVGERVRCSYIIRKRRDYFYEVYKIINQFTKNYGQPTIITVHKEFYNQIVREGKYDRITVQGHYMLHGCLVDHSDTMSPYEIRLER